MNFTVRTIVLIAMILLTMVSMWTTYVSLHDSILPEPVVELPLFEGFVWKCSIVALGLSVAIGLMLFALKAAIVNGQKRLNIVGILGLTVVAFISIAFNMDVLYRTADRAFFLRYSNERMRGAYEEYLAEVQGTLSARRTELLREVAKQEGELDAEIRGLRKAPAGYGQYARQEDYRLTLLQKTTEVELKAVDEALLSKAEADALLRDTSPESIEEIDALQQKLRAACKDIAGASGVPLPPVVQLESPLFAVFGKLFDFKTVGLKEIFFLMIAFFLDLGDIIGYSLLPNRKPQKKNAASRPCPTCIRSMAPSAFRRRPCSRGLPWPRRPLPRRRVHAAAPAASACAAEKTGQTLPPA